MTDTGTQFISGIEKMDLNKPYEEHNPSRNPLYLVPKPGHILIRRLPFPEESTRAGIIIPAKTLDRNQRVEMLHPPNCGRIIAITKGCWVKLGDYAFWAQRVPVEEEYYRKPQPVITDYDPQDQVPTLWTIDDQYVTCCVSHAGDPDWVDIPCDKVVKVIGISGRISTAPAKCLMAGEIYSLDSDKYFRVLGIADREGAGRDDPVKVFAAPYDGRIGAESGNKAI